MKPEAYYSSSNTLIINFFPMNSDNFGDLIVMLPYLYSFVEPSDSFLVSVPELTFTLKVPTCFIIIAMYSN